METETGYNGWTNWETWHVSLLAENDEPTYKQGRVMAQACLKFKDKGQYDPARAAKGFERVFHKAWMATKRFAAENQAQYGDGWKLDDKVDWLAIAEHWIATEEDDRAYTLIY